MVLYIVLVKCPPLVGLKGKPEKFIEGWPISQRKEDAIAGFLT
jgi:hypothetical protein